MNHILDIDPDQIFNTVITWVIYAVIVGALVIFGIKYLKELWHDE